MTSDNRPICEVLGDGHLGELADSALHTAFIAIRTAELKLIRTQNSQIGNKSRKEPKWMLHTARERSRIEQVHSWD